MWFSNKGCTKVVEAMWSSQECLDPNIIVVRKIEKCGKELKHWSKVHFGNVRSGLNLKKRLLVEAEEEAMQSGDSAQIRSLEAEINDLLDKESRIWLQRSKVLWAKNGDQNSKYFHRRATQKISKKYHCKSQKLRRPVVFRYGRGDNFFGGVVQRSLHFYTSSTTK